MRLPGQIRLSWTNDNQLQLETEAGAQTRRLVFGSSGSAQSSSLQGSSTAQWIRPGRPIRGAPLSTGGQLRVVTTQMTPGYLRKNGVPYSGQARLTEYFNRVDDPETGESWLIVVQVVEDPTYLNQRFFTSSHFKKVSDSTPWQPSACTAR
jgi:hypothetical protein